MKLRLILPALLLPALLGACSELKVTKIPTVPPAAGQKAPDLDGVPFYLPRQDFVASVLGFDENGKPTSNSVLKIELVTRPDPTQGYLIKSSPGAFSTNEFEITRDAQGRLLTLSAKNEDKTFETVTALASVVVKAAAFAGEDAAPPQTLDELQKAINDEIANKARVETEIKTLKAKLSATSATAPTDADKQTLSEIQSKGLELKTINEKLKKYPVQQELLVTRAARLQALKAIEKLSTDVGSDGKAIKLARENLAAINDRLAALQSSLADSAAAKGVTKSDTREVTVQLVADRKNLATEAAKLKSGQVGVFVIPR